MQAEQLHNRHFPSFPVVWVRNFVFFLSKFLALATCGRIQGRTEKVARGEGETQGRGECGEKIHFFLFKSLPKISREGGERPLPPPRKPSVNLCPLGLVYICMQIIREESTAVEPANISLSGIPIKKIYW